jgi:hypothetical protein
MKYRISENRMRTKLGPSTIVTLECPPDKDRIYFWDATLAGFGLVAHRSGKKAYVVQYRDGERSRRKTIGHVESMEFAEARAQAKTLLAGAGKKTRRRRAFELKTTGLERVGKGPKAVVSVRFDRKLLAKIDEWIDRRVAPGQRSRSAVIRMFIEYGLQIDGRCLPSGRRVKLVVEEDDMPRKSPGPKTYAPNGDRRTTAIDRLAVARVADKYVSRDGTPKK